MDREIQVQYSSNAIKFIKKQEAKQKLRLRNAIEGLKDRPMRGDIKLLEGYKDGRYRLRVGTFRVIFKILESGIIEIVYIMDIGNRGDIYK